MSEPLTIAPRRTLRTFLDFPLHTDLDTLEADVAILGLPYGDPYSMDEVTNDQTNAPTAVRVASRRIGTDPDRWDFDIGGRCSTASRSGWSTAATCRATPRTCAPTTGKAEAAAKKIWARVPLLVSIGGDHGVPIPIFRGLESRGPVTLVHVDAHLDWRDEVNGAREGYSSTIRRGVRDGLDRRRLPDRHPRAGQRAGGGVPGRDRLRMPHHHLIRRARARHAPGARPGSRTAAPTTCPSTPTASTRRRCPRSTGRPRAGCSIIRCGP